MRQEELTKLSNDCAQIIISNYASSMNLIKEASLYCADVLSIIHKNSKIYDCAIVNVMDSVYIHFSCKINYKCKLKVVFMIHCNIPKQTIVLDALAKYVEIGDDVAYCPVTFHKRSYFPGSDISRRVKELWIDIACELLIKYKVVIPTN